MIFNSIGGGKNTKDANITEYDVVKGKIAYGATDRIVGKNIFKQVHGEAEGDQLNILDPALLSDGIPVVCGKAEDTLVYKEALSVLPSSDNWYSFTYGNGKFVAVVYQSDKAAYSTDGINWTATTLPSSANCYSVTYGNGKFIAVTYGSIAAYSIDGINWTQSTLPVSKEWYSVCYGNGKFVAVADHGVAAYSTDGINWTQSTLPTNDWWYSVCYGNGKFVAVSAGSNAAYSTDGINWTQTTLPARRYWYSVCYGNGKFVAVTDTSDSNIAAYSTDGITWTQTTMPASGRWPSVCYGADKFVAVARNTNIAAYSTDGINWTATVLPFSANRYSVTYGNGKFVAVAFGKSKVAYSTDGINWVDGEYDLYLQKDRNKIEESWAGPLTFTGSHTSATYVTQADSFIAVDKTTGTAFIVIRGGTSTSYENIYFNPTMTLPSGVTALPTQTYGGPTSGARQMYFTQVLTGITGKIKVTANMDDINSSYDYVRCTLTVSYA